MNSLRCLEWDGKRLNLSGCSQFQCISYIFVVGFFSIVILIILRTSLEIVSDMYNARN